MFQTNIKTAADLKEEAKIARARHIEAERKPRFFNARNRIIGVDVDALKKQMEEKEARKASLRAEDAAYLNLQRVEAKRAKEIEATIADERRRYQADILEFRRIHQTKEKRREFDLNDPENKRKDKPCRLGDDDPRLTISSMQKFKGEEGTGASERKKMQREQIRTWLVQQIKEKKEKEEARKLAEFHILQAAEANDKRIRAIDEATERCKRELDRATREFNLSLAKEKENEKKEEKKRDLEDTMMHTTNMINSELLSGNPAGEPSQLALGKVTKSSFRGMSEEELKKIKEEQLKQIEDNKGRRQIEDSTENDWLNLEKVQAKRYVEATERIKQQKKCMQRELIEENRLLAEKQRARRIFLNEHVFKSPGPEPYFYEQFNTITR